MVALGMITRYQAVARSAAAGSGRRLCNCTVPPARSLSYTLGVVSGPDHPSKATSYCGDPGFGPRGATFSVARATAVANARLGARCNGPFTVAVT